MAKLTVMDLRNVELKISGLSMVVPPKLSFKIVVDLPKEIEKEAAKDPLLLQEFKSQASEILDQTKKPIEHKCKVFDKLFVDMVNKGASDKDMKKQLDGLNKAIQDDMRVAQKAAEMGVIKTFENLKAKRKEWKKFKIQVGCSIAGTLAGLAVSIAAMATSPWSGGAGAAFAIIGFIKSGVKLAEDILKLAMNINQSKMVLEKHLKFVEAAAKKKGLYAANEVSAAIVTEFLGVAQPSIKSVDTESNTLRAKYAQMIVKVHDLSKTLEKILKEQDKLKKEFLTEVAKKLKAHPIKDKSTQLKMVDKALDTALSKNYQAVDNQIMKVQTMYADTRTWAKTLKDLLARVEKLKLDDPKGLKVFREALKFAMLGTAIFDGDKVAETAKDLGMGLGSAVGGYAYDKITSKAIDGTIFDAA